MFRIGEGFGDVFVDTNVWLERLLDQERSEEVARFLDVVPSEHPFITDLAFHSIALVLCKLDGPHYPCGRFNLDFDDAYQYAAAEG